MLALKSSFAYPTPVEAMGDNVTVLILLKIKFKSSAAANMILQQFESDKSSWNLPKL